MNLLNAIPSPWDPFDDQDLRLFKEGAHTRLYEKLGSQLINAHGVEGTRFAVWAPNATAVSVVGDFNGWSSQANPLGLRQDGSGIWAGFVPRVGCGALYKYRILSGTPGCAVDKADPFALTTEAPPGNASRVWSLDYDWGDGGWMQDRRSTNALDAPISIYEVHLGSWRRARDGSNAFLNYREIAMQLADYAAGMGFTHVELMPVSEHFRESSWGYHTTGCFAATSRYGTPQDLMYLVDLLHQRGIGVFLDWAPSPFADDEHGLALFDGTRLFEPAERESGLEAEGTACGFDYARREVRSFLTSCALFWLERYHVDGLRVAAVASMLCPDDASKPADAVAGQEGETQKAEAIEFLRGLNESVYRKHPDVQMFAEGSADGLKVSRPIQSGGLGFGMKWNTGWTRDTLKYLAHEPSKRKDHREEIGSSIQNAFGENFLLPLAHDEAANGARSLWARMPGDAREKAAGLRLLYGYMWAHPGKKLLFMGGEFGQLRNWRHDGGLDWELLQQPAHGGIRQWIGDLNHFYRSEPGLHAQDFDQASFAWVDCDEAAASVISLLRKVGTKGEMIIVVCNFASTPHPSYRVGVPRSGYWKESLNSDAPVYGGTGVGNFGGVHAAPVGAHGMFHSLTLDLPPLGAIFLKHISGVS